MYFGSSFLEVEMNRTRVLLVMFAAVMLTATAFALYRSAPKAYSVAEINVTDPVAYKQYLTAVTPVVAHFGGKYVVRAGQVVSVEGDAPTGRVVVIEFDSLADARRFESSAEYQAIAPLRRKAAHSRIFLVEGTPRE
jgi:uncharacterized protein (DUF1330 family)